MSKTKAKAKKPGKVGKAKFPKPKKPEPRLTPMQEAFVRHYVNDPKHNATQAARKAGYSEDCVGQQGYENLKKPEIKKAVEEKLEIKYDTIDITGDRIIREIAKVAFGNLKDVAQWDGDTMSLKASDQLTDDEAALLKSISVSSSSSSGKQGEANSSSISFQTFDKLKALELLAKNKKLLTDKIELKGKIGLEALVAGSNDTGSEED